MIKHIVIWQLKEQANGNAKTVNAHVVKERLESLNGVIPGLITLEVGIDISNSDMSGDLALYSVLESKQALNTYQQHPAHREIAQFIASVTLERQVVDYEI